MLNKISYVFFHCWRSFQLISSLIGRIRNSAPPFFPRSQLTTNLQNQTTTIPLNQTSWIVQHRKQTQRKW